MVNEHTRRLRKQAERLVTIGNYAEALPIYRRVLANDDANGKAWYGIGYVFYKLRRGEQAVAALRQARAYGYEPAGRLLTYLNRREDAPAPEQPAAQEAAPEPEYPEPVFEHDSKRGGLPASPSRREELEHICRQRQEELDAFRERLAARAMALHVAPDSSSATAVRTAQAAHEVTEQRLIERRRAWKAIKKRCRQAEKDDGAQAAAQHNQERGEAKRAYEYAEQEHEAASAGLREAMHALADAVLALPETPGALRPLVYEIGHLQHEITAIEAQLGEAMDAESPGPVPERAPADKKHHHDSGVHSAS
ncbi:MAG: tetratricopeptide repeat protein [Candidatus Hydrogenedentota bacterium]